MKRFGILLLTLALLLSLCACGDKAETATETTAETAAAAAELSDPSEVGEFEGFSAAFTGAELFTDRDGDRALRVYFDFLNRADTSGSPAELLLFSAVQDGSTLRWSHDAADDENASELSRRLLPGVAGRFILQFKLISDGEVTVTLDDGYGHSITARFDPDGTLPGAPGDALTWSGTAEDTLTTELPSSCTLYDLYDLTIVGGEVSDAADGGRIMTVRVDLTNNGDIPVDPAVNFLLHVYQDGTELPFVMDGTEETVEAAVGETRSVLRSYPLNSESPVLVELFAFRAERPSAALVIPVA